MTFTLKIDNPDTKVKLQQVVKDQKEITIEALRKFLDSFQPKKKFHFEKKDPRVHCRK